MITALWKKLVLKLPFRAPLNSHNSDLDRSFECVLEIFVSEQGLKPWLTFFLDQNLEAYTLNFDLDHRGANSKSHSTVRVRTIT